MKKIPVKEAIFGILVLVSCSFFAEGLDNGLARTPPMGWMTWQRFRCNTDCTSDSHNCISEKLIREQADMMVSEGYLAAGYEYIVVDDCWLDHARDNVTKRLRPDPARFPSGIRALADYVHARGLKFGIYEDYGTLTCGGFPGSLDYLQKDAQTFADWTVDYLKLDGCYSDPKTMDAGYPLMGKYLNETNRPIVYSCSWPAYQIGQNPDYKSIARHCNMWRNYDDIDDSFQSLNQITEWFAQQQETLRRFHGPGHWNDPDMLVIGNFGLSKSQSKAQMALWSVMAAPLLMSTDLTDIEPWAKEILQNRNALAINQDSMGAMGIRFNKVNNVQMWRKPLTKLRTAFVFYAPEPYGELIKVSVQLKSGLGLIDSPLFNFYETFSGKLIGQFNYTSTFTTHVQPSGSVLAFWAEPVKSKQDIVHDISFV